MIIRAVVVTNLVFIRAKVFIYVRINTRFIPTNGVWDELRLLREGEGDELRSYKT